MRRIFVAIVLLSISIGAKAVVYIPATCTASEEKPLMSTPSDPNNHYAPVVYLSVPSTGTEGVPVTFDTSGSYDPDGDEVGVWWQTSDCPFYTFSAPGTLTHTFSSGGIFIVKVSITDGDKWTYKSMAIDITGVSSVPPPVDVRWLIPTISYLAM